MSEFARWAVETLLASALLLGIVLLVRAPVRRWFGPQVAYALWALPVLRLLLPPLPAEWGVDAATPITRAGETMTVLILPSLHVEAAPLDATVEPAASLPWGALLIGAWVLGVLAFMTLHTLRHRRFCRAILDDAQPVERIGRIDVVESGAATGPLAFGIGRRYVAFPRDFDARYDADERALALAHELGHHARGDLVANWIALAVLALHWFNPLAWRAFGAFRADQELANDARVLAGRSRVERHIYACAIVKAAHGGRISAACHLHTVTDLKGRLRMLTTNGLSRSRLIGGGCAVATLTLAALGVTASGTQAAERVRVGVQRVTGVDIAALAPAPVDAIPPADAAPAAVPLPPIKTTRHTRVVVVTDGKTRTYEGAAAEAYLAANPAPPPPAPPAYDGNPVPPPPPAPPAGAHRVRVIVRDDSGAIRSRDFGDMPRRGDIPQVESMTCPPSADREQMVLNQDRDGQRRVVICTDRIAAASARAQAQATRATAHAGVMREQALRTALVSLRQTKASMLANRDMADWERTNVADSIDDSIREVEDEIASER